MEKGKVVEIIEADLEPIIPRFMDNSRKELQELMLAFEEGDMETLRRLGHNTKGAGYGYGFTSMGQIGEALERAAKDGDSGVCAQKISELKEYLQTVQIRFE